MNDTTRPAMQFLGAADTVTGSRYLIEAAGQRILVDCGLFQGYKQLRERNRADFPVPPDSIDTVLLTHAHLDHSGYIPALVRNVFRGKVLQDTRLPTTPCSARTRTNNRSQPAQPAC